MVLLPNTNWISLTLPHFDSVLYRKCRNFRFRYNIKIKFLIVFIRSELNATALWDLRFSKSLFVSLRWSNSSAGCSLHSSSSIDTSLHFFTHFQWNQMLNWSSNSNCFIPHFFINHKSNTLYYVVSAVN